MAFLERNANRGSISTASYDISNSLKLESDNSENIYRQIIELKVYSKGMFMICICAVF